MTALREANLRVLGRREDGPARTLASALGRLGPAPDLGVRDRQGRCLPGIQTGDRARALVSTFDPGKEAQRWAEAADGGTVAVWGGAGRAAYEALAAREVRLAFWVEPRLEVWNSLLTWEDWTGPIADLRWVPVWDRGPAWETAVKERYHPLWDGTFRTLDWRAATAGADALWEDFRQGLLRALDGVAADTSTQARFGERWYRNALANLKHLAAGRAEACPGARVVVAGAGPTLGDALEKPENRRWLEARPRTGDRLFSTDTALPALTARGVVPDLIFCLDGQLPSYHHFVPRVPEGVPLVADLASLPLLGRRGLPTVRYLSGHPFGSVVRRYFPEIPVLDGSLGNVSGLAWGAAALLGAREVGFWGVDFAYRDGQAYTRGTYVYDLASRRADRLRPGETLLGASCYGARGLERSRDPDGHAWDTTPLLRDYRGRWEAYRVPAAAGALAHGEAGTRWPRFVSGWRERLESLPLPAPGKALHPFVLGLPPDRRQDWAALWPLALALHRQGLPAADRPWLAVDRALSFLQD